MNRNLVPNHALHPQIMGTGLALLHPPFLRIVRGMARPRRIDASRTSKTMTTA